MSEQIREQLSAFLDGELPNAETELLLKRLLRDGELRDGFGRYALIGEALRGGGTLSRSLAGNDFMGRMNRAIDGEPTLAANLPAPRVPSSRWWRPFAGAAVAAGVCAMAVLALQQREVAPAGQPAPPMLAQVRASGTPGDAGTPRDIDKPREALSYTVPTPVAETRTAMPAARLTNYVFAHSKYSSPLGQENILSTLLTDTDEQDAGSAKHVDSP